MTKILLANLGNRNIKYKGNLVPFDEKTHFLILKTFRNDTKTLLEHYETEKDNITLNILPVALEEYQPDVVYLFVSNQKPEHHQDTLHEGEIVKRHIQTLYPTLKDNVHCLEINGNVAKFNALIPEYKQHRNQIKANYPEAQFIVADAGGTPQQKQALKVLVDFLSPNDSKTILLDLHQQKDGSTTIEKQENKEYTKILIAEQVLFLCEKGNYSAVAELLEKENLYREVRLIALHAHYLLTFQTKEAQKQICDAETINSNEIFKQYWQAIKTNDYSPFAQVPTHLKVGGVACSLCLSVAQFYLLQQDAIQFLLWSYRFQENYLNALIESHSDCKLFSDYDNQEESLKTLLKHCKEKYGNVPKKLQDGERTGIPSLLYIAGRLRPNDTIVQQLQSFNRYFSPKIYDWGILRNNFAHKGIGFDWKKLEEKKIKEPLCDAFVSWCAAFQLPEKNNFVLLNEMIQTLLS